MKRLVAMVLAGMMVLSPIAVFAEDQEHILNISGYCFTYPDNWEVQTNTDSLFDAYFGDSKDAANVKISTVILKNSQVTVDFLRNENVVNIFSDSLRETQNNTTITDTKDYSEGVLQGTEIDFIIPASGTGFRGKEILVPGEDANSVLCVVYSAMDSCPNEFDETFDNFIKTATTEMEVDTESSDATIEPPFDDLNLLFHDHMDNDVTGKWRVTITSTPHPVSDYIEYYYKTYVKPDDTVHVIVNFTLKTTTLIRNINAGFPYFEIATYEYVDGDERDAKQCPGGISYGSQIVFTDTWEVQNWDEYWDSLDSDKSEEW